MFVGMTLWLSGPLGSAHLLKYIVSPVSSHSWPSSSSPVMSLTESQISAARVASAEGVEGELRGWVSRLMGGGGGGSEGRVTLFPPLAEENILRFVKRLSRSSLTDQRQDLISAWVSLGLPMIRLRAEVRVVEMKSRITRAEGRSPSWCHTHWYHWAHCWRARTGQAEKVKS